MDFWQKAQKWEKSWWGSCTNTLGEETKQLLYAEKMGLIFTPDGNTPYRIDMEGKSVLDIGGGPCSLLLKCVNVEGKVIDSLKFPSWVYQRYRATGIEYVVYPAEDLNERDYDEVWIYNMLQHVDNPKEVIIRARGAGKIIRIFEWIGTPANIGHPHTLTEEKLNYWLGGEGKAEEFKGRNNCFGKGYYGIFIGENNE